MRHELGMALTITGALVWAMWIVGMVYGAVESARAGLRARRLRRPVPPSRPGLRMVNGGRR